MSAASPTEEIVHLIENAASQVKEMLAKEENAAGKALRLFIESGGCSGLQYGMTLDEKREGDYAGVGALNAELGTIGPTLKADLARLSARQIPVDVLFDQGP